MSQPLAFVGMSGVGKSFWASRFAQHGFTRHDCDGEIARHLGTIVQPHPGEEPVHALGRWMGMPWTDGYAEREARYLALEEEVTRSALDQITSERHVLDTTGSVIYLSAALLADLRARCRVVYLRTPRDRRSAMLTRYLAEPKPVVWGGAFVMREGEGHDDALRRCYETLLDVRDARYTALAHVTLDGAELEANPPPLEELRLRCQS